MKLVQRIRISLILNILKSILSFLITISIASKFGPENFGLYSYILALVVAFRSFIDLGSQSAILTFASRYGFTISHFINLKIWNLVQIIICICVFYTLSQYISINSNLNNNKYYFLWLIIILMAFFQYGNFVISQNVLETLSQTKYHLIIHCLCLFCNLIILKITNVNLTEYILYSIAFFIFFDLVLCFKIISIIRNKRYKNAVYISKKKVLSFYKKFSTPLILLSLFSLLFEYVDRQIIIKYASIENQGFYSLAHQFSAISLILVSSTFKPLWTEISKLDFNNDSNQLNLIITNSICIIFCLCLITASFTFINIDLLITSLINKSYLSAKLEIVIILLAVPFTAINQLFSTILLALDKSNLYGKVNLIVTFTVLIVLLCILQFNNYEEKFYIFFLVKWIVLNISLFIIYFVLLRKYFNILKVLINLTVSLTLTAFFWFVLTQFINHILQNLVCGFFLITSLALLKTRRREING